IGLSRGIGALIEGHKPQTVERESDAVPVSDLSTDVQACFIIGLSRGIVTLHPGQYTRPIERLRALRRPSLIARLTQCPHTPLQALREITPRPPEALQRTAKTQPSCRRRLQ